MYASSPTIGDWETFIAEDLVGYIDKSYRTFADRMSRGLGGHSMGGYGTLRVGMKRPDVFSVLYPMSSCCLMNNAGGGGGRGRGAAPQGARGAANQAAAPAAPSAPAPAGRSQTAAPQGAGNRGEGARGQGAGARGRGGFGNVQFALAAAFSPNPKNPPQYFDLPVTDGVPNALVAAKMAANSPLAMVDQDVTSLKKYKAIKMDVGLQDGLAASNQQLAQFLSDFGVTHTFETYEGDHSNRVVQRIEQSVLPFFSSSLAFTAPRR